MHTAMSLCLFFSTTKAHRVIHGLDLFTHIVDEGIDVWHDCCPRMELLGQALVEGEVHAWAGGVKPGEKLPSRDPVVVEVRVSTESSYGT